MKITLKMARRLTKKVVAEAMPGTVRKCQYTLGGEPHCIVAVVLFRAGATYETLDDLVGSIAEPEPLARLACDDVRLTPKAAAYLKRAQWVQDMGHTWTRALKEAEALASGMAKVDHDAFMDAYHAERGEVG